MQKRNNVIEKHIYRKIVSFVLHDATPCLKSLVNETSARNKYFYLVIIYPRFLNFGSFVTKNPTLVFLYVDLRDSTAVVSWAWI